MTRESERGEPARRVEVVGRKRERAAKHTVRLDVVRRVAGFPGALLVGKPEQVEPAHVVGPCAQARLELQDESLRVAGGEARRQPRGCVRLSRGRAAAGVHAAEEEGGGGNCRRRPCD